MSEAKAEDGGPSDLQRLHEFCRRGVLESVTELVTADPQLVVAEGGLGFTALHYAAQGGHAQVCQYLLDSGANVNAITENGDLPLHLAAWGDHIEAAQMLIYYYSDTEWKNKEGKSPSDMARSDAMREILPGFDQKDIMVANEDED